MQTKLLINGKFVESKTQVWKDVVNPATQEVLARVPFESFNIQNFCGKTDCRHVSVVLGERAGLRDPLTVHNFYVPAGGDEPDPEVNEKFRHKLDFLDEMTAHPALRPAKDQREVINRERKEPPRPEKFEGLRLGAELEPVAFQRD